MATSVSEIVWIVGMFKELGAEIEKLIIINSDSKSTIHSNKSNASINNKTHKVGLSLYKREDTSRHS